MPVRVADVDVIVLLVVVPEVQSHTKTYQAVTNRTKLFKELLMRNIYLACQGCGCSCDRACLCCS